MLWLLCLVATCVGVDAVAEVCASDDVDALSLLSISHEVSVRARTEERASKENVAKSSLESKADAAWGATDLLMSGASFLTENLATPASILVDSLAPTVSILAENIATPSFLKDWLGPPVVIPALIPQPSPAVMAVQAPMISPTPVLPSKMAPVPRAPEYLMLGTASHQLMEGSQAQVQGLAQEKSHVNSTAEAETAWLDMFKPLSGLFSTSAVGTTISEFPATIGQRTFIGAIQRHITMGPIEIHPYDLAFYLDDRSPLWTSPTTSIDDVLINAPEYTTVQYVNTLPSTLLAQAPSAADAVLLSLQKDMKAKTLPRLLAAGGTEAEQDSYINLWFSTGLAPIDTRTTVEFDHTGLTLSINGERKGRLESTAMCRAFVSAFLGSDANAADLRESFLFRLRRGLGVKQAEAPPGTSSRVTEDGAAGVMSGRTVVQPGPPRTALDPSLQKLQVFPIEEQRRGSTATQVSQQRFAFEPSLQKLQAYPMEAHPSYAARSPSDEAEATAVMFVPL